MGACCVSERQGLEVTADDVVALQKQSGKGAPGAQTTRQSATTSSKDSSTGSKRSSSREGRGSTIKEKDKEKPSKERSVSDKRHQEAKIDDASTAKVERKEKEGAEKTVTEKDPVENVDPGPKRRTVPADKVDKVLSEGLPKFESPVIVKDEASTEGLPKWQSTGGKAEERVRSAGSPLRSKEDAAATRIQASYRGKRARAEARALQLQKADALRERRLSIGQENPATLRTLSMSERSWSRRSKEEEEAAATKIQAAFRGKRARDEVKALREERPLTVSAKARQEATTMREARQVAAPKVAEPAALDGFAIDGAKFVPQAAEPDTLIESARDGEEFMPQAAEPDTLIESARDGEEFMPQAAEADTVPQLARDGEKFMPQGESSDESSENDSLERSYDALDRAKTAVQAVRALGSSRRWRGRAQASKQAQVEEGGVGSWLGGLMPSFIGTDADGGLAEPSSTSVDDRKETVDNDRSSSSSSSSSDGEKKDGDSKEEATMAEPEATNERPEDVADPAVSRSEGDAAAAPDAAPEPEGILAAMFGQLRPSFMVPDTDGGVAEPGAKAVDEKGESSKAVNENGETKDDDRGSLSSSSSSSSNDDKKDGDLGEEIAAAGPEATTTERPEDAAKSVPDSAQEAPISRPAGDAAAAPNPAPDAEGGVAEPRAEAVDETAETSKAPNENAPPKDENRGTSSSSPRSSSDEDKKDPEVAAEQAPAPALEKAASESGSVASWFGGVMDAFMGADAEGGVAEPDSTKGESAQVVDEEAKTKDDGGASSSSSSSSDGDAKERGLPKAVTVVNPEGGSEQPQGGVDAAPDPSAVAGRAPDPGPEPEGVAASWLGGLMPSLMGSDASGGVAEPSSKTVDGGGDTKDDNLRSSSSSSSSEDDKKEEEQTEDGAGLDAATASQEPAADASPDPTGAVVAMLTGLMPSFTGSDANGGAAEPGSEAAEERREGPTPEDERAEATKDELETSSSSSSDEDKKEEAVEEEGGVAADLAEEKAASESGSIASWFGGMPAFLGADASGGAAEPSSKANDGVADVGDEKEEKNGGDSESSSSSSSDDDKKEEGTAAAKPEDETDPGPDADSYYARLWGSGMGTFLGAAVPEEEPKVPEKEKDKDTTDDEDLF